MLKQTTHIYLYIIKKVKIKNYGQKYLLFYKNIRIETIYKI